MSDLTRDVVLRISAKNLSTADFKQVTAAVNELTNALDQQIEAASKGIVKEKELTETLTKLKQAGDNLKSLAGTVQILKGMDDQFAAQTKRINDAKTAWESFQATVAARGRDTPTVADQRTLTARENAYNREIRALEALQAKQAEHIASLEKAGLSSRDLVSAEQQLLRVADEIGAATTKASQARDNYAKTLRETAAATKAAEDATRTATRAEEEHAAALKNVEIATKKLDAERQASQLKEIQAGAKEFVDRETKVREAREKEIKADVAAFTRGQEQRIKAEKDAQEERRRTIEQNDQALREFNQRNTASRMDQIKREIEESNRVRSEGIAAEREAERRRSLGIMGRFREDWAERRRLRRQERDESAQDERQRGGAGGQQRRGFLGLQSYQLTNVGYQVGDIFQGLASGQPGGLIAIQQGPQLLQILGTAALRWFPVIGAAAAAAAVAIGTVRTALRELSAEREFSAAIAANVSAIGYSANQLNQIRKDIEDMGVSTRDAMRVIRTAMAANISQDRIKELAENAKNVAKFTGDDIPAAMKKLVDAFTSGQKGIRELNTELNFLNDNDLKRIDNWYKEGKGIQAVEFALSKLTAQYKKVDEEGTSEFQKAVENLTKAWNALLRSLSDSETINSVIRGLTRVVGWLQQAVEWTDKWIESRKRAPEPRTPGANEQMFLDAVGGLPPTRPTTPAAPATAPASAVGDQRVRLPATIKLDTAELNDLVAALREASKTLPEGFSLRVSDPGLHDKYVAGTNRVSEHYMRRALDVAVMDQAGKVVPGFMKEGGPLYDQIDAAVKKYIEENKLGPLAIGSTFTRTDAGHFSLRGPEAEQNEIRRGAPAATRSRLQAEATKKETQAADDLLAKEKELYDQRQASSREEARRLRAAQALKEAQDAIPNDEARQKALVDEKMAIYDLEQKIKLTTELQNKEREQLQQRKHGAEVEAARAAAIKKAQDEGIKGYETLKDIGDRAAQIEEQRLNIIDQENEKYRQTVRVIDELKRANDSAYSTELENRLEAITTKYRLMAEQIKKTRDEAALTDKARYDRQLERLPAEETREKTRATGDALLSQAQTVASTRKDLINSYERLRELGEISIGEFEEKEKSAFENTAEAMRKATDDLQKFIEEHEKLGDMPVAVLEKYKAQLAELRAEAKYIDPFIKGLSKTIEESFTNRAMDAFDDAAEAIGEAIAKTKEWKDVWSSLRSAAANFFAGILKDIATYIIKAQLAKLASSFLGGGTGGAGGILGGLFSSGTAAGTVSAAGTVPAAVVHSGGIIGLTQLPMREAPGSWFDRAPRYHNGGVVGLAANESTAILQRGEEVLAANSPRHARNWGGGGRTPDVNIRNVLVADPELVPSHMGSLRGEKVIMNTLTKNAATVRQLVR